MTVELITCWAGQVPIGGMRYVSCAPHHNGNRVRREASGETRAKILAYIGAHPWCTSGDVAKALKIKNSTMSSVISKCGKLGLIEYRGQRRSRQYKVVDNSKGLDL